MCAHLHNNPPPFLYYQSLMYPIVKGGGAKRSKIKLTKISKMASGLEFKGDPVPLASVVLTSDDIVEGEIVMKSSRQD